MLNIRNAVGGQAINKLRSRWSWCRFYRATVDIGVSGGVDSAVALHLLKSQGYNVRAVHMQNWDARVEDGEHCTAEEELRDVERICRTLNVPLRVVSFVEEYWERVFNPFIDGLVSGLTPNPDAACNRYIKFDCFTRNAFANGADFVATGHYARLLPTEFDSQRFTLSRSCDRTNDQSYFLSRVKPDAFTNVLFPLAELEKDAVRSIAQKQSVHVSQKKSSVGLCFVGKRRFDSFISQFVQGDEGNFVDIDSGQSLGTHCGLSAFTIGQRARISGQRDAYFVCGKDMSSKAILVCRGALHPALLSRAVTVSDFVWQSEFFRGKLLRDHVLQAHFLSRYRTKLSECTVECDGSEACQQLRVHFRLPLRAATPGQVLALYVEDYCVGGGLIDQVMPWTGEQCDSVTMT